MKDILVSAAKKYIYQLDEFPQKAVEKQIKKELEAILSLNKKSVLKKRLDNFKIGKEEDYINHIIETSEGPILAGIRHMNVNPDKPFVSMWPGFKIQNFEKTIKEIEPYFEIFKPKSYRFWIRPDCNDYDIPLIQQRFIGETDDVVKYDLTLHTPSKYL